MEVTHPARILLVDDDVSILSVLVEYFNPPPDMEVIASASGVKDALTAIAELDIDLVFADVVMPEVGGLAILSHVNTLENPPVFISMTGMDNDASMLETLTRGGAGYILKSSPPETFHRAVRDGMSGGTTISAQCLTRLLEFIPLACSTNPRFSRLLRDLPRRDVEVLRHVVAGHSNSEISLQLVTSESSVKRTVSKLMDLFGTRSRVELALRFRASELS